MKNQSASSWSQPNRISATPWFRAKWFKVTLTALGVIAVILVVLFNRQISDLLNLFGTRAALETKNFVLDGTNLQDGYFLGVGDNEIAGYDAAIWDPLSNTWTSNNNAVQIDNQNRLVITP